MSSLSDFDHLKFPFDAIKLATNNFDNDHRIGQGGFGNVYKGELIHSGRKVMVAIKRLDPRFGQGNPEFWKEIIMLSHYKHDHLVSLLGFCDENGENILVYEYLSNKSLDKYLDSTNLSWIQRLNICIGMARGLEYLHNPGKTMQRVLHRDIKSSNILLDKNWSAKISDFGLSKFGPANQDITFLITHGVGTMGYCDPLYMEKGFLTKESDIYSFGVVLFEVLCGRLGIMNYDDGRRFLSNLAKNYYEEKKIGTIVLNCLREQIAPDCLDKFSAIAYQCLQRDRNQRPQIARVLKQLEIALQWQVRYNFVKDRKLKSRLVDMSEEELKEFDGRNPDKPLLIAIKDQIYDVSRSRMFYGPGGPYAMFAGKNAVRAFADTSFDVDKDLNEDLTDPSPFELEILKDLQENFSTKYVKVGFMKNSRTHNNEDSGGLGRPWPQ